MLTRQERQEIAEKAKLYKGKELDWDNITDVLIGSPCWESDDELLDRIIELCEAVNVDKLAFMTSANEMYLQALKAKHECIAAYVEADSYVNTRHIISCIEESDTAIAHYKRLIEKEQQC